MGSFEIWAADTERKEEGLIDCAGPPFTAPFSPDIQTPRLQNAENSLFSKCYKGVGAFLFLKAFFRVASHLAPSFFPPFLSVRPFKSLSSLPPPSPFSLPPSDNNLSSLGRFSKHIPVLPPVFRTYVHPYPFFPFLLPLPFSPMTSEE